MNRTPTAREPSRLVPLVDRVGVEELVPASGLEARDESGRHWLISAPHASLKIQAALEPGWYEVRLGVDTNDKFSIRKSLEIVFESADGEKGAAMRDVFCWYRTFRETFICRIKRPTSGIRIEIRHADGKLDFTEFGIRRMSSATTAVRAVHEKVQLTRAYKCFGRTLFRGTKMLMTGRFHDFGQKMMKSLTDARTLRMGGVCTDEVDGAWWRRSSLSEAEAERCRAASESMIDPPLVTVVIPVVRRILDAARLSALAIRRQLYPHWQLYLAVCASEDVVCDLERLLGNDPNVSIIHTPVWTGPSAALARVVTRIDADRIVIAPPGVELTEDALYHFAVEMKSSDPTIAIGTRVSRGINPSRRSEGGDQPIIVWATPTRRLTDSVPADLAARALSEWAVSGVPTEKQKILAKSYAHPIEAKPLAKRQTAGARGGTLVLAANLLGITGYDHVTYAILHGFQSSVVELRLHPKSFLRAELIPPSLLPQTAAPGKSDPVLIMTPPAGIVDYNPGRNTVAWTMWETDRLDPKWVKELNRLGLILVPSRWQADCFRADGIETPIKVVPLGFDPLVYHPGATEPDVCTFGTAGALTVGGIRKNAQWVIDVFRHAFPSEPDVRLRVKISPGSPSIETFDDPRIDVIRAVLPNAEMADWYRSLTAYVNGSAGEGFGLHLIEAMACGRPVVSAARTGLTEYFDAGVGYVVESDLAPVKNEIYQGNWVITSEQSMIARLREVYTDPNRAARLGTCAAARAKSYTWKASSRKLIAALREHRLIRRAGASDSIA